MIPNQKGEIPVLLLFIPFVCGLIAGITLFTQADLYWLWGILLAFILFFILLNLKYQPLKLYKQRWLGGALAACILFLSGWILPLTRNELSAQNHFSKTTAQQVVIQINSVPVEKNGLIRFTTSVKENVNGSNRLPVSGTLLVTIKDSLARQLKYGDELLIPAKYTPVQPPLNPAEFNYKAYLAHKNIFYQAFIYHGQYKLIGRGTGNSIFAAAIRLREHLVTKLRKKISDTGAYAVTSAMLLGYRADLSEDVLEAYVKTGTVYVLTVSGAQVAMIWLALSFSLRFLDNRRYGKLIKAIIIIAVVWYYAMLTGFSVSICRAAVMLSLVIIGKTSRRYINTLNLLAVSAFLLLCYDPYYITEVGFQLSYLAVSGVIILRPVIYKWFSFKNKILDRLWSLCSFSVAIQLAIFPLCAFYFHQLPVYFLVSNVFVFVPASIVLYAGALFLVVPALPGISQALAFIIEKVAVFMNKGLVVIEHLPGCTIDKVWLSGIEYLLLFLVVISLFFFWLQKRVAWLYAALTTCFLFTLSRSVKSIDQQRTAGITWLSLGKHPGIVFRNGRQALVLTDLTPGEKQFKYSIQPYLDSDGVTGTTILKPTRDVSLPWLRKRLGMVQFLNTKAIILNGSLGGKLSTEKLKADFIYLTGNPQVNIQQIGANFEYRKCIIDGSNSDARIDQWKEDAEGEGPNIIILKRNKSLASISN